VSEDNFPSEDAHEILVVDADAAVQKGLVGLLKKSNLIVTTTADPARGRDQLVNKFYAVALVDVDTPQPEGGLEFLAFARASSPQTAIILMSNRKSFDLAVAAFRGGATDIVLKHPDHVGYLRDRVLRATQEISTEADRRAILEEVAEIHESFLSRMRDLARQKQDLEEQLIGREETASGANEAMRVVLVDEDRAGASHFAALISPENGWELHGAGGGGEALDLVAQVRPHLVLVKETLPDLPASMVVKSLKQSVPDAVILLYAPPISAAQPGEVKLVEGSRMMMLVPHFVTPSDFAGPLAEIREGIKKKLRERKYLQSFRQSNFELLRRYGYIKRRIDKALTARKGLSS